MKPDNAFVLRFNVPETNKDPKTGRPSKYFALTPFNVDKLDSVLQLKVGDLFSFGTSNDVFSADFKYVVDSLKTNHKAHNWFLVTSEPFVDENGNERVLFSEVFEKGAEDDMFYGTYQEYLDYRVSVEARNKRTLDKPRKAGYNSQAVKAKREAKRKKMQGGFGDD